jgi:hypothetical protein
LAQTQRVIDMEMDIQVSFHVHGADLDPDQVTRTLLLEPYCAFRRGDTKTYKSGKFRSGRRATGATIKGALICVL